MPNDKEKKESSMVAVDPTWRCPLGALVCRRTSQTAPLRGRRWRPAAVGPLPVHARAAALFLPPLSASPCGAGAAPAAVSGDAGPAVGAGGGEMGERVGDVTALPFQQGCLVITSRSQAAEPQNVCSCFLTVSFLITGF